VPPPIRVLRVITRLNIGGPAIHAVLLTSALDDGALFSSTLVAGTTAPHEGDMLDFARAHAVHPVMLPALGREISPADDLCPWHVLSSSFVDFSRTSCTRIWPRLARLGASPHASVVCR